MTEENPLSKYTMKRCLLDISEDANTTETVEFAGYELLGVATPATLDDASTNYTFSIDPGDGTFRILQDDAGAPIILTGVTQAEIFQVQESKPPIVGARIRLQLSADEDADRVFQLLLRKL